MWYVFGKKDERERLRLLLSRLVTGEFGVNEVLQSKTDTIHILGVPFSTLSFVETIQLVHAWMAGSTPRQVVTANPEFVMAVREDPDLRNVVQRADLITPDGIGIVYAARVLANRSIERVTGADMLPFLFEKANEHAWPVYLLGASAESNRLARQTLSRLYPKIPLAGRDGFFSQAEVAGVLSDIRNHRPRLLLVGLGSGKQEKFIADHLQELQVPVAIGVGGCIDLYAGTVKRAPRLWQKLHLEWLYRLLRQPSRWRRQLALPRFAWAVVQERFRK